MYTAEKLNVFGKVYFIILHTTKALKRDYLNGKRMTLKDLTAHSNQIELPQCKHQNHVIFVQAQK